MLQNDTTQHRIRRGVVAGGLLLLTLAVAAPAQAQTAATRYARALDREKAARSATAPAPATLRAIAKTYEGVVRAYPRSGYADNALWQAAGVLSLAYERSKAKSDLDAASRMLGWLKREYPHSDLARQVNGRLAALRSEPKVPPKAAAAPAPQPPTPAATAAAVAPAVAVAAAPAPVPPPARAAAPGALVLMEPPITSEVLPALARKEPAVVRAVPARDAPTSALRSITHSVLPKGDRLTIEMSQEIPYSTVRAANPDRVTVDLSTAGAVNALAERAAAISGTLVKSVNIAGGTDSSTRFVLELAGQPRFSTFPLYNPFRLVIDLESDAPTAAPAASSAGGRTPAASRTPPVALAVARPHVDDAPAPASAASTSRGDYSIARQLGLGVSRIVIDPGHGGHDPGATANGVTEADLVLDVARRLETLLAAQPGFEVVLTRRTDEFIALEERTAIANRERADMFVSIHANASPRPMTRGIETYFLDFATTPDAEALAARENASSAQTMRLLPEIVKTITLTNKLDESRELARMVQTSLVRRLSPMSRGLKDLGVKRAPFVVLIGAQMPSVLAEISFLTNKTDAGLLKQASHRQRIAQALADAVLKYSASLKATPPPATRTAAR